MRRGVRSVLIKRPPNRASRTGLQAALAALNGPPGDPVTPEEYLALREQWRREDEARRSAQGCLELRATARGAHLERN